MIFIQQRVNVQLPSVSHQGKNHLLQLFPNVMISDIKNAMESCAHGWSLIFSLFHRLLSSDTNLNLAGLSQMKVMNLWGVNIVNDCCAQLQQLKARLKYGFDSNTIRRS